MKLLLILIMTFTTLAGCAASEKRVVENVQNKYSGKIVENCSIAGDKINEDCEHFLLHLQQVIGGSLFVIYRDGKADLILCSHPYCYTHDQRIERSFIFSRYYGSIVEVVQRRD